MTNFDDLKLAVESLSGGKNTVILDDLGMPSIMVAIPVQKYADVITGGTQDTLPAFLVDGVEIPVIYESKYQNIVVSDRAYSLPFKDPRANIDFDTALQVCRNKGAGWHLQTNALWGALMNWCYKNKTEPHGNTNYGKDYNNAFEKGVVSYTYTDGGNTYNGRTATGSGPVTWYHNYDSSGIADLCGNVWEWVSGLRLVTGEIQIIPYGNAMKADCNMGADSTEWKAIMPDGSLVAPGTAGTLKFDGKSAGGGIRLNTTVEFPSSGEGDRNDDLKNIAAADGVNVPQLLKGLGLYPDSGFTSTGNHFWLRNHEAERLPCRGASWDSTSSAGVGALDLAYPRSYVNHYLGFRAAFYGTAGN